MRWFKFYTSFLTSTMVQEADMAVRGVWAHILCRARLEDPPGQFKFVDAAHLARMWNTEAELIERALSFLVKTRRLRLRKIHDGFLLSVINWEKYQGDGTQKTVNRKQGETEKTVNRFEHKRRLEEKRLEESKVNPFPPGFEKLPFDLQDEVRRIAEKKRQAERQLDVALKHPSGGYADSDGSFTKPDAIQKRIASLQTEIEAVCRNAG